jgi:hypothetical protein
VVEEEFSAEKLIFRHPRKNIWFAQFLCVRFSDLDIMRISAANPQKNHASAGFQIQIRTATELESMSQIAYAAHIIL